MVVVVVDVVVDDVVVVLVDAGSVVEVVDGEAPEPVVPVLLPGEDPAPVPPPDGVPDVAVVVVVVCSGAASNPLLVSTISTCRCTVFTTAATAAGVPRSPSNGRTFSSFKICSSCCSSRWDGAAFSVTTIWSAIAVVAQAGQFELRALASFTGAMTLLCPTISTIWNDTATVVQAVHLPVAVALFVGVTA